MKPRVALVTPSYGDQWREGDLVCRRVAGALAAAADVTVVVAAGGERAEARDAAVRLLRLPAFPLGPGRRAAVLRSLLGPEGESCGCVQRSLSEMVDELPRRAQEEIVRAGGGDSPALWAHLAGGGYDVVVFAGLAAASTVFGVGHAPPETRVVLLPLAADPVLARLPIIQEAVDRAQSVMVVSDTERRLLQQRMGEGAPIRNTGFVLRVNEVVRSAPPYGLQEGVPAFVVAGDWTGRADTNGARRWVERISAALGEKAQLRVVGPGAASVLRRGGEDLTGSRIDVWRWMSRATALIDPTPRRVLGREALEALLLGTPIVVPADGGVSREHAQVGDGGLWYRTETELVACLQALLDPTVRDALGRQGQAYATNNFTDPDRYIQSVVDTVLE